ncbi:MAG: helix-turn-helix domain-containing protein [Erysipelotrichaceae bacterium]|nr:helix-turn-helix domain-containing protein [Erysipelotrichaceae bacterium]
MTTIGENIKKYRENKQLSQRQLKDLSGVHEIQIAKYETNKSTPSIETLRKIANGLEIPVYLLLDTEAESFVHTITDNITKKIIDIGGCDASSDYDRGWDEAIYACLCGIGDMNMDQLLKINPEMENDTDLEL